MSQNAKQLSLQIRRCATPSYILLLYVVALVCVAVDHAPVLVLFVLECFHRYARRRFHLAIYGCNMWAMQHTEDLHMLWMHVDGSP